MNKEKWIHAKPADFYGEIEIVEFIENKPSFFNIKKLDNYIYDKSEKENLDKSELKIETIDSDRIRFHTKGKKYSVYANGESVIIDHNFQDDYVKILPTKTSLSIEEIESLQFHIKWNDFEMNILFNQILDSEHIQEINARLNKKGSFIKLGKIENTLILVFYSNGDIEKVLPIKEITNDKIVLYGFPEKPYEIVGKVINS